MLPGFWARPKCCHTSHESSWSFLFFDQGGALCQAHPPVCMPKLRADGFLGSNCYKNHLPLFKMVMASNAKDSFSKGFVNKIRHGDMDGWVSLL